MGCEPGSSSDERICEALITEVIEAELNHIPSEDVPPVTLPAVELNKQDDKMVDEMSTLVLKIGDKLKDDVEIQDQIEGLARNFKLDKFNAVAKKVFKQGIVWERIAAFIYVAGKLAAKMVELYMPQFVMDILKWTVDFFKNYLLGWIQEHGGWICSLSALAVASVLIGSSVSSNRGGLVIMFFTGMALGAFVCWRLTK